jgi:hypothetical protein
MRQELLLDWIAPSTFFAVAVKMLRFKVATFPNGYMRRKESDMGDTVKHIVKVKTGTGIVYLQSIMPNSALKLTKVKRKAHQFDSSSKAQHFINDLPADLRPFIRVVPAP